MRRILTLSLLAFLAIVMATLGIGWYLLHDEAFLKSRLNAFMVDFAGRELHVDGRLNIEPGRHTVIEASGIRLANAAWAENPDMVRLGRLRAVIDIPTLFGTTPVIPSLRVEDCRIELLESDDGETNWAALAGQDDKEKPKPARGGRLPAEFLDNTIHGCVLEIHSPDRQEPLIVEADDFELRLEGGRRWKSSAAGRVDGESLTLTGWMEPAGALLAGGPLEHELDLKIGQINLHSEGSLEDAATGTGADIAVNFRGPEIARLLSYLGLPRVSEGPFDFRMSLKNAGSMTALQLRGDFGLIEIDGDGEVNRLQHPEHGSMQASLKGPNLQALGQVFGVEGLIPDAFTLDTRLAFEPGLIRFDRLDLNLPQDSLSASGVLGVGAGLADSDLGLKLHAADAGRWAPAFGRPARSLGPLDIDTRLTSAPDGLFSIFGTARTDASSLTLRGAIGTLAGPLRPDLDVDFHSRNAVRLAALAGVENFPPAPLTVQGHLAKPANDFLLSDVELRLGQHFAHLDGTVSPTDDFVGSRLDVRLDSPNAADLGRLFDREDLPSAPLKLSGRVSRTDGLLQFDGVKADLAGHRISLDGTLNPTAKLAGSRFDVRIDSPDAGDLALLLGTEGFPHEPLQVETTLEPVGKGLRFRTSHSGTGGFRLAAEGQIADLEQPSGLNADFDIALPSFAMLSFLAPNWDWPDLPAEAQGHFRTAQDRSRLEGVHLKLGDIEADVTGDLYADRRFDLNVDLRGPDASELPLQVPQQLAPEPFSLKAHVSGVPAAFDVDGIVANIGNSNAVGDLQFAFDPRKRVSGKLSFSHLDLSYRREQRVASQSDEADAEPAEPASPYVFDDTPIPSLWNVGMDLDLLLDAALVDLGATQWRNIEVGLLMTEQMLRIEPLSLAGPQGGRTSGRLMVEQSGDKPHLVLNLQGDRLRLGVTAVPGQDVEDYPPVNLNVQLEGYGVTRREMASSLNGRIRWSTDTGQVARAGLELLTGDFFTELLNNLNPFAEKTGFTELECSVVAATLVDGIMEISPAVYRTTELTILSQGKIDLHSEKIQIAFNTKPRQGIGLSAGALIHPMITVGGTLKQPAVELNPTGAIVSGGTALATAGLSIVAKSVWDRYFSSKDPCGDAEKAIAERDAGG